MATTPQAPAAAQNAGAPTTSSGSGTPTAPKPANGGAVPGAVSKPANPAVAVAKPVAAKPAPKPAGPAFKLSSLTTREKYWKFLIYGQHGIGKTELAGSCADVPFMCDVFFLSAEKGETTIEETDRIANKAGIFPATCDNMTEVSKIKDWLVAHCAARDANDEEKLKALEAKVGFVNDGPAKRFYTCAIDSLTEIQAFSTYLAKGYSDLISLDSDLMKTEWDHYNQILDRMQLLMRAFRDLPMHVIFLAQEAYIQDETKKMVYSPNLQGQMAKRVQGFVDIVGYLTKAQAAEGKEVRRLFIQPPANGKYAAKNRKGNFKEAFIDDPHMLQMMKLWGQIKEPDPSAG